MYSRAQGTIEYLVILAIVVVIGLAVVGLSFYTASPSTAQINSSVKEISGATTPISFTEGIIDADGNGIVSLQNNTGENITITKITTGGIDNNYSNEQITLGNYRVFSFEELGGSCTCSAGEVRKTCSVIIYYTGDSGLEKTLASLTTLECVANTSTRESTIIVAPTNTGAQAPVSLSCWSEVINPHPICTLNDLNQAREHLDWDYILSNDINASDTESWTNGFTPINDYAGTFDGDNHTIFSLYIKRVSTANAGMFSRTTASTVIERVTLSDVNISVAGCDYSGALVGRNYGLVSYANVDGNITNEGVTTNMMGMLVGGNLGIVEYSSVSGTVAGKFHLGGLVGLNMGTIKNSFSSCNVSGMTPVGGLVGSNYGPIYEAYSTGTVTSSAALQVGGLVGLNNGNVFEAYSTGAVTATSALYSGGLVGDTFGVTVRNSFAFSPIDNGAGFLGHLTSGTLTNNYWDIYRTGKSSGGCSAPNCNGVNSSNVDPTWAYYDTNAPLASWGTWTNSSGDKWSTTDGNWSICRGAGLPWLTWENRSC